MKFKSVEYPDGGLAFGVTGASVGCTVAAAGFAGVVKIAGKIFEVGCCCCCCCCCVDVTVKPFVFSSKVTAPEDSLTLVLAEVAPGLGAKSPSLLLPAVVEVSSAFGLDFFARRSFFGLAAFGFESGIETSIGTAELAGTLSVLVEGAGGCALPAVETG